MGPAPEPPPDDDHDCYWRHRCEALERRCAELEAQGADLEAKLASVMAMVDQLQRRVFGPKSEKMPPAASELRRKESPEDAEARRLRALERRRERLAQREKLRQQTVVHHVIDDEKECPKCGGMADCPLGKGKETTLYEYVPGYFIRQRHVQEKLACACRQYVATAPPPPRPIEGGAYGPGFIAHVCVMKCADSIPLHRLAKQYQRLGIPMSRSTLTDLFHAAAEKLAPLSARLLMHIARTDIVQADETPLVMQKPHRKGYLWTFVTDELIGYRFSPSRSGDTPHEVLGGTPGTLVVDAYTGYNRVADVDGRDRAGCLAHVRRKFFDALATAPVEAREAMDLILEVYRIEQEARARNIVGAAAHLELRRTRGRAAMNELHGWLQAQDGRHPPKSPLGVAVGYALNQWDTLTRFLDDPRIPPDNNASERALRVAALGRKNFLFVGNAAKGGNLAGLYSLVATCELHEVDPIAYLSDVLMRVDFHPARDIDDLLPHRWAPPQRIECPAPVNSS